MLFGDRTGLALFLGVVLVLSAVWRVGFYITDSYAIANTVVNVAEGSFAIRRVEYSLTLGSQPGLYRNGTDVFGRNYAAAVLSAPFYWLLKGASTVFELRVVLAAGWSLLAAGFAAQAGRLLDSRRIAFWGTVAALGAFVANLALATPLDPHWSGLIALQLSSLLAAGVVAVALYRLGIELYDRRVGIAAGLLASLGLPIAFWATIPKRHVFSAALIAIVLLSFARSRRPSRLASRAAAYAAVGVLAWLHAAEGLVVLAVLLPIDILTAPTNDRRAIATVVIVFALALLPFVLTNLAVAGTPLEPPRMLPGAGDAAEIGPDGTVSIETDETTPTPPGNETPGEATPPGTETTEPSGQTTLPGSETTTPPGQTTPPPGSEMTTLPTDTEPTEPRGPLTSIAEFAVTLAGTVGAVAQTAIERVRDLWTLVADGISIVVTDHDRVAHVFVRSGEMPGVNYANNEWEAIELSVVESAPVLGTVLAVPFVLAKRLLDDGNPRPRRLWTGIRSTPRYQTDLLAIGIVMSFTLLYLTRLPVHAQITVRYLVPVMPVALYGVLRIRAVNRGIADHWASFLGSYAAVSAGAVFGVVALFARLDPAVGEAMQFHALLNLAVAGTAAGLIVVATLADRVRLAAVGTGAAGGAGTALFVLAGVKYFTYGEYLLPVSGWLSQLLASI
ncbi:putative membrane protein [Halapricum desulfuricans]|uniref:Putative membrane protein n=1 Tax=Halapricum desulfuricans TaxID=2841257 RepID=A0A897N2X6_9EURY|nr:putative membrane protein [Halapricum desulfuricans]